MTECATCWGTGFVSGFGGPCTEGCPAPTEKVGLHVDAVLVVDALPTYTPVVDDRVEVVQPSGHVTHGTVCEIGGGWFTLVKDASDGAKSSFNTDSVTVRLICTAPVVYIPAIGDRVEVTIANGAKYIGKVDDIEEDTLDLDCANGTILVLDLTQSTAVRELPTFTAANVGEWRWFEFTTGPRIEAQVLNVSPDGSRLDTVDQGYTRRTLDAADITDSGIL